MDNTVCSCLDYYPFHQSFFPQLWTLLNVLLKKLRGIKPLKNHKGQLLRHRSSEIKCTNQIQYQPQFPMYRVLACLLMITNTQPQTCLRGEEQTLPKLNFHDKIHDNLIWRRLASRIDMHQLGWYPRSVLYYYYLSIFYFYSLL